MKIVYLKHPVSAELKAKHRAAGEKIMDAKFAPADYQKVEPVAAAPVDEPVAIIEPQDDVEYAPEPIKRRGRPRKAF